MKFIDCKEHYSFLDTYLKCVCKLCNEKFLDFKKLNDHLSEKHNQFLCKVCFDYRTLFPIEHQLYSKKELELHEQSQPLNNRGHPMCEFCTTRFYDYTELHKHLKQTHMTCHMCPPEYQHRYYKNLEDLIRHFKDLHFFCDRCPVDSLQVFNNHHEYLVHANNYHCANSVNISFGVKRNVVK